MLHFKIEQDPFEENFIAPYQEEPFAEESVQIFKMIKTIIRYGKRQSLLSQLREAERKLIHYCQDRNLRFQLGERPLAWHWPTGAYLFDIEIPAQEDEEFRAELTKWRHS